MSLRRFAFLALVLLSALVLLLLAARVVPHGPAGFALLACLAALSPWGALGFAQSVLGLAILLSVRDPASHVLPAARRAPPAPIRSRTAIALCLRNEAMEEVLPALGRLLDALPTEGFDAWLLSDTRDAALREAEDRAVAAFRDARADAARIHLRRRAEATGFKAGNVMSFLDAEGSGYDFALVLDADSEMSGEAVLRLAALLESDGRIGLVQQLIVGRPVTQPFPRLFQFGMRAGMRAWATGQGWWQGPKGPYWGHNAMFRVSAFREYARLETLPDGSAILSHDQVEAIRLHEAGWEVWCWPEERGSLEGNPPALPEFLARDERWAAGNMQYLALLRQPGLGIMARWQLAQAILLFICAPLWALAFALALGIAATGGFDAIPARDLALIMFAWWAAAYSPKLAGYAQVLLRRREAARYGGRGRFLLGALAEILFTFVLAPVSVMSKTRFLLALAWGRRSSWLPQNRAARGVGWGDAARLLWPQTAAGLVVFALLAATAPRLMPFALVWVGGLLLAVPFCVLSSSPGFGRILARSGIAATPEEVAGRAALSP
ncbi:glucans biosynthesis glucosyltransferase MdoH [Sabulicella glaciei]|uniref:Glucans biosynthesis glucosyltransferase H n=1 Tax=Sabulicella glaciei TaxID=2984948 RepID=A0ABT3NTK0_9PROT|nr:glucans biosynthesis glucosyltransferase MdoH [Roseococcus sp. MDT2-1-1]MCW8085492.1 glucans biosynthesis glucosyltransferase MdoH [Roseococcus sp. MDT2-1-1]